MRGTGRPCHQALDSAQARRRDRQSQARNKLLSMINTAVKLEAKHPAKSVEHFPGALMVRMPFEAWIIDGLYGWMRFKEARQLQGRVILMAYADPKSFHTTLKEEAGMWIKRTTEMTQLSINLVNKGPAAD